MKEIDWKKDNICFVGNEVIDVSSKEHDLIRKDVEPWLTAIFQSEHLSLLLGTGLTTAICSKLNKDNQVRAMGRADFTETFACIKKYADSSAEVLGRGFANFEDDIRTATEYLKGLRIQGNDEADKLEKEINNQLKLLIQGLLSNEQRILKSNNREDVLGILRQFLTSFASRTATRDRLHIFTTNYDRLIEYALDDAGIYTLDRFVGKLNPIMRMHKMELDYHYNPPGIRGEPRYVEGVVRYTKIHGSLDWQQEDNRISRIPLLFGGKYEDNNPYSKCIIYPNSSKAIETAYFPYSELFRDLSTAICRPNSVLVTYGYGFGDSHVNSIILDMMNILSTHLVIISYDTASGRIQKFVEKCNQSQISLLIGNKLGDITNLVDWYLPKAAIDKISDRKHQILEKRDKKEDDNQKNPNGKVIGSNDI